MTYHKNTCLEIVSGNTYVNNMFRRVGEQPVLEYNIDVRAYYDTIFTVYRLVFSGQALFSFTYKNGILDLNTTKRCTMASTADLGAGKLHVVLDPLQYGEDGQYQFKRITRTGTILNSTLLFILGT